MIATRRVACPRRAARPRSLGLTRDMRAGDSIGGWQAVAQAPLDYISGNRHRYIGGSYVRGSYSDPWWVYCPVRGWAIARRWRSKAQKVSDPVAGRPWRLVDFPALTERAVEPCTPPAPASLALAA